MKTAFFHPSARNPFSPNKTPCRKKRAFVAISPNKASAIRSEDNANSFDRYGIDESQGSRKSDEKLVELALGSWREMRWLERQAKSGDVTWVRQTPSSGDPRCRLQDSEFVLDKQNKHSTRGPSRQTCPMRFHFINATFLACQETVANQRAMPLCQQWNWAVNGPRKFSPLEPLLSEAIYISRPRSFYEDASYERFEMKVTGSWNA